MKTIRFCIAHNSTHEEENWRWRMKRPKKKNRFYCHEAIDCVGCKEVHLVQGFQRLTNIGWVCEAWIKRPIPTPEQKIKNLSPEEVMSGVQYGNKLDPAFKGMSSNNYSEERAKQVKALKEAVS